MAYNTPPAGPAGGDLAGSSYPNPVVVSIGGKSFTLGAALAVSGAFSTTLTVTGVTNLTLPTSGTLATLSNNLGQFGTTTSAQLASILSDETGTGSVVFGTSPALTTPTLSGAIAGTYTLGSGATWNGVAVGTQFGGLGANNSAATGIPVFAAGVATVTAATGTGAPVRATSPTLVTPTLGVATATSLTAATLTATGAARVLATNTSGQSIPNGGSTTITGWTTTFDANSNFNAATGVFTAPLAGFYLVTAQIGFNGTMAVGTSIIVPIQANGVPRASGSLIVSNATVTINFVQASALVQLAVGQTITLQAFQNSGGAVPLTTGALSVYVSITQMP